MTGDAREPPASVGVTVVHMPLGPSLALNQGRWSSGQDDVHAAADRWGRYCITRCGVARKRLYQKDNAEEARGSLAVAGAGGLMIMTGSNATTYFYPPILPNTIMSRWASNFRLQTL